VYPESLARARDAKVVQEERVQNGQRPLNLHIGADALLDTITQPQIMVDLRLFAAAATSTGTTTTTSSSSSVFILISD
jgi:hypothetical protein